MKTLDDGANWKAVCLMIVDLALNDEKAKRPQKTGHTLIEFVARELNDQISFRYGQQSALRHIYGSTRKGAAFAFGHA